MDITAKLKVLDQIYSLYNYFTGGWDYACQRYCAYCCTSKVTMTTLEGYKIVEHCTSHDKPDLFEKLKSGSCRSRFQPKITTNKLTELYAQKDDMPDEKDDSFSGKCPLLVNNECPVYQVRPFGCRCFVSIHSCQKKGYAEIDPILVTINTLFLQFIEHVDSQGCSGNLTDMLMFMQSKANQQAYKSNRIVKPAGALVANHPIKVLFIPPEHKNRVKPVLQALYNIKVPGEQAGFD